MAINLFDKKEDCCGCSACYDICPKNAISMQLDELGFIYPTINNDLCIECGLCKKVCGYTNPKLNESLDVYAAVNKNITDVLNATSGGIFTAVAKFILSKGGIVYGVSLDYKQDGSFIPHHIEINDIKELYKLQKSKYVQSNTEDIFKSVKRRLVEGNIVLFSGTPCQISGLKGYLQKDYDNLFVIDLICHGVPSSNMFNEFIAQLEQKYNSKIIEYNFRDKKKGWGSNASFSMEKDGKIKKKYYPSKALSYMNLFYDCAIFRESCYSCPFAKKERIGDITIGDFWGIEKEYPNLIDNGLFDLQKGVSCILVNTEKGKKIIESISDQLNIVPVDLSKIMKYNHQLSKPASKSDNREFIFDIYINKKYQGIEEWFDKEFKIKKKIYCVYSKIPDKLKKFIKYIKNTLKG